MPAGPPFFPDLSPPPLRGMLALSGVFHVLLAALAFAVSTLQGPAFRLEPVAVVDLVGGGEIRKVEEKAPGPPAEPSKTEKAPPAKKAEKAPPAKKAEKARAKKAEPVAAPDEYTTSRKRAPDTSSVQERVRQMREARRREDAAHAAVRGVGERVAHRIEAPPAGPAQGTGGTGGGAPGTVRVPPEILAYFRRLNETVRGAWVLPESVARDAGKLMVVVRIVIEKDGRVSDSRIERGSGNVYFDESVLRAIRKASPLPVPPEQLRGGEDHYEVGFRFHGSEGAT